MFFLDFGSATNKLSINTRVYGWRGDLAAKLADVELQRRALHLAGQQPPPSRRHDQRVVDRLGRRERDDQAVA